MKVGILVTGAPPPELGQRFGDYAAMVRALLGEGFDFTSYDVVGGQLPRAPEEQDAYVVTGSPAGVYDDLPWIAPLKDFLRAAKGKAKLIGICFGHQIMAEAFGGHVEKAAGGWGIGLHRYEVKEQAPWMDGADSVSIPVSHQDQVVAQPPASRVIAGSAFNRFGILAYDDQPAISFQCHPEFDPAFAGALIESRRDRLVHVDDAIASLEGADDRARVAGWMRAFLAG
jgi:GMP synthase-like glutamine amidotransferase